MTTLGWVCLTIGAIVWVPSLLLSCAAAWSVLTDRGDE